MLKFEFIGFEFLLTFVLSRSLSIFQIDENSFHCLTCNEVLSRKSLNCHFDSDTHKINHDNCRNLNTDGETQGPQKINKKKDKKKNKKTNVKDEEIQKEIYQSNGNVVDNDNHSDDEYIQNVLGAKDYIIKKDNKNFCILCDWECTGFSVDDHVKGTHHLAMFKLHKERMQKNKLGKQDVSKNNDEAESTTNSDDKSENKDSMDKILEAISEFAANGINIKLEMRIASCKKCSANIDFDYDFIKNHIEEHKKKDNNKKDKDGTQSKFDLEERKDEVKSKTLYSKPVTLKQKEKTEMSTPVLTEELMNFGKKHDLAYKNNRYFCPVCSLSLEPTLKVLKDHIDTVAHKNRLARQVKAVQPSVSFAQKIRFEEFTKTVDTVENLFFKDVVINDKICIDFLSLMMYKVHGGRLICYLCGTTLNSNEADEHKSNDPHVQNLKDALVVTSIPDEFVRQVCYQNYFLRLHFKHFLGSFF